MLLPWIIAGVIFVVALLVMMHKEAKCMRRDEKAIDPMLRRRLR